MLRRIIGFAVLAIIAIVVFNLALSLLGAAWNLAWLLLRLALVGVVIYWVLKLIAPSTARRVEDIIKGQKA
jgi:uncharacterized membrane protein